MKKLTLYWLPLLILIPGFCFFFYFHLYQYINLQSLKAHQLAVVQWRQQHYLLAVCGYVLIYIAAVSGSIPGTVILTLVGGFLFGVWQGALYAILSITIGSTLIFLFIKMTLTEWFTQKAGQRLKKLEEGFQKNAFHYVIVLRLIPVFPLWLINFSSALLGMRLRDFVSATLLGLIPSVLIYASVGRNLDVLFRQELALGDILFQPAIWLPLGALAVLAVLSIGYKSFKNM